jgi:hypothetical protein
VTELETSSPKGGSVSTRALPPAAIDPGDVIALVPGTSPEDAVRCASLATLAVSAAIYPNELPPAPLPAPLHAATLAIAGRFASSGAGGSPVVSESLGSYTWRRATPALADLLELSGGELKALAPWSGKATVYDVSIAGAPSTWPYDWFQRDLDNVLAASDALELEAAGV